MLSECGCKTARVLLFGWGVLKRQLLGIQKRITVEKALPSNTIISASAYSQFWQRLMVGAMAWMEWTSFMSFSPCGL